MIPVQGNVEAGGLVFGGGHLYPFKNSVFDARFIGLILPSCQVMSAMKYRVTEHSWNGPASLWPDAPFLSRISRRSLSDPFWSAAYVHIAILATSQTVL